VLIQLLYAIVYEIVKAVIKFLRAKSLNGIEWRLACQPCKKGSCQANVEESSVM